MAVKQQSIEERLNAIEMAVAAQDKKIDEVLQLKLMQPAEFVGQLVKDAVQIAMHNLDDKQAESIVLRGLKSFGKELIKLPFELAKQFYDGCRDMVTKKQVETAVVEPVVEAAPVATPAKA